MIFSNLLPSKWLSYVIEAVIIVASILGAFALDRWNEDRKENILELELLNELIENSNTNIESFNFDINYLKRGTASIDLILDAFENNQPYDSALNIHFASVPIVPKLVITDAAYHSMKLNGMRIITNDSLRKAITNLYEQDYDYVLELNNKEWDVLFDDHRDIYRKKFGEFEFFKTCVPVDYDQLKRDEDYINYLKNRKGWLQFDIETYESRVKKTRELVKQIQGELKIRS